MSSIQISSSWHSFFVRLSFELIVIVVGILVALAISEWTSEKKDRALEQEYLERLIVDMQSNLQVAASSTKYQQNIVMNARRVLPLIKHGADLDAEPAAVVAYAYWASAIAPPDWIDSTHQELLSTGRYTLLRNRDLRNALLEYYGRIMKDDQMFVLASTEYRNAIRSEFDPELQLAIRKDCDRYEGTCQTSMSSDEVKRLINWMRGNDELARLITRVIPQSDLEQAVIDRRAAKNATLLARRAAEEAPLESSASGQARGASSTSTTGLWCPEGGERNPR